MKTILVPTDFSLNATNALRYAVKVALQTNSKLVLYHTYFIPLTNAAVMNNEDFRRTNKAMAERKIEELQKAFEKVCTGMNINRKKLKADFKVGRDLVSSFITRGILACAVNVKADLIIMGTHGATGLEKVLIGSNTADVLKHSKIPVLAVPRKYHFRDIKTIVYASDIKHAEVEFKHLLPLAKSLKAEIEILHMEYNWDKGTEAENQYKNILKKFRYNKLKIVHHKMPVEGPLVQYLKEYMARKTNSILAMFPSDRNFIDRILLLDSKVVDMLGRLNRPLLSIKK